MRPGFIRFGFASGKRLAMGMILLTLFTGGCSLSLPGQGEPPRLYTLSAAPPEASDLPSADWQLVVGKPLANGGLDTGRIAVRRRPYLTEYLARAAWIDTAPGLVHALLVESFENSGKVRAVARDAGGLRADFLLQTELRDFHVELMEGQPPQARVRLAVKIIDLPRRAIMASHSVTAVAPASAEAGQALVNGMTEQATGADLQPIIAAFDTALRQAMGAQIDWVLRSLPQSQNRPQGGPRRSPRRDRSQPPQS